jgi:hypothetical protein
VTYSLVKPRSAVSRFDPQSVRRRRNRHLKREAARLRCMSAQVYVDGVWYRTEDFVDPHRDVKTFYAAHRDRRLPE